MNASQTKYGLAIVGGGIVGLGMAWAAARRGESVILLERSPHAVGASIRNFGMVWPIGQPPGERHALAMRSRELWLELAAESGLWVNPCGSLHLLRHEDELAVAEEFVGSCSDFEELRLLTPTEVAEKSPAARIDGLLGALWSPTELCVNPPAAIATLTRFLSEQHAVEIRPSTAVTSVRDGQLHTASGEIVRAERIAICSGSDLQTLHPEIFASSGLQTCKLQMLATAPQPNDWRLGPHLAGGLTLRHYRSFAACPTLPRLRDRIATELPLLDRYGIHVMASQNELGEVILGDSHEYGDAIAPFDSAEIERLILEELDKLLTLPDLQTARRWHGVYVKHPTEPAFLSHPTPQVLLLTGLGGAGMTLSLALTEQQFESWS